MKLNMNNNIYNIKKKTLTKIKIDIIIIILFIYLPRLCHLYFHLFHNCYNI